MKNFCYECRRVTITEYGDNRSNKHRKFCKGCGWEVGYDPNRNRYASRTPLP